MSCFSDTISIKGTCSGITPISGLYLDDIGINEDFISTIVGRSFPSAKSLYTAKLNMAIQLMKNQLNTHFQDRYRAITIVDGSRIGYNRDNFNQISGAANLRGFAIEFCNSTSYLDLFVSQIGLFIDYTGTVPIKVIDLLQSREIDTIDIDTIAGQITTKFVGKTYKSDRQKLYLFFGYDATSINSYQTTIGENGCTTCGDGGITRVNRYMNVQSSYLPLTGVQTRSTLKGLGDTAGLSMMYSLECNHEDWLCEKRQILAVPLLYKTAAQIYHHALTAFDRNNSTTLIDREHIEDLYNQYEDLYSKELESVVANMMPPKDPKCFMCKEKVRQITTLP